MKAKAKVLLGALLFGAWSVEASELPLTVKAHVTTAGPYGETWDLFIPPEGQVTLEIAYMLSPMGEMKGHFFVSAEQRAAIRESVEARDFFGLPDRFWPDESVIHAPSLVLTVGLGERRHEVRIFNPDAFEDDPQVRRFLEIWRQVFSVVPLKPAW